MASTIRVLDEKTINQIAAGEVIENPSSVVKELVENSLDAQARDIHVEIRGGGRQLIRVTDDGIGMSADDAILCLERHATSKIRQVDDVHSVDTMGFRGEAIPSIASIARFTLLTCPSKQDDSAGTLVIVDGGKVVRCCDAARSRGTTMEVKSLFFNVPARRKFQKSPQQDANEILKVLTHLALAHPEVRFELVHNQETLLTAPAAKEPNWIDQLGTRIEAVLGKHFLSESRPAELELEGYRLHGWFGLPNTHRSNRNGQYLLLNRRAVTVPQVSFAVRDAYGHSLPHGRHPNFVLHLDIPPAFVDVNVHPQKREIRLRHSDRLQRILCKAVDQALHPTHTTVAPSPSPLPWDFPASKPAASWEHSTNADSSAPLPWETPQRPTAAASPFTSGATPLPELQVRSAPSAKYASEELSLSTALPPAIQIPEAVTTIPGYLLLDLESCRFMGDQKGIWICDQRAAHHRILFDRLSQLEAPSEVELLLVPQTLALSPIDRALVQELLPELRALGLGIEEFGPDTLVVNAIPRIFDGLDVFSLIQDLIAQLREMQKAQILKKETQRCVSLAASRLALFRSRQLTLGEAQDLLKQLFRCQRPRECPQGKPTMICLSSEQITNLFKR